MATKIWWQKVCGLFLKFLFKRSNGLVLQNQTGYTMHISAWRKMYSASKQKLYHTNTLCNVYCTTTDDQISWGQALIKIYQLEMSRFWESNI